MLVFVFPWLWAGSDWAGPHLLRPKTLSPRRLPSPVGSSSSSPSLAEPNSSATARKHGSLPYRQQLARLRLPTSQGNSRPAHIRLSASLAWLWLRPLNDFGLSWNPCVLLRSNRGFSMCCCEVRIPFPISNELFLLCGFPVENERLPSRLSARSAVPRPFSASSPLVSSLITSTPQPKRLAAPVTWRCGRRPPPGSSDRRNPNRQTPRAKGQRRHADA